MKAGIIYKGRFVTAGQKAFTGYIDYIDRDEASRKKAYKEGKLSAFTTADGYNEYMGNPEKSTGLFTADKDSLSEEGKKELKKLFEEGEKNGSIMLQNLFSFEASWLRKYGILTEDGDLREDRLKQYTRAAMATLIEKEGLEDWVWSAAIHYNTKHYHIHIAMIQPKPSWEEGKGRCRRNAAGKLYQRGKMKKSSNKAVKSRFANLVMDTAKTNNAINEIVRNRIVLTKKNKALSRDTALLKKEMESLLEALPNDLRLWKYNKKAIRDLRPKIDGISDLFIETYFKKDFEELKTLLSEQSIRYKESYGGKKEANTFVKNKIKDLYERLGNAILEEARQIEKERRKAASGSFVKAAHEDMAPEFDLPVPEAQIPDTMEISDTEELRIFDSVDVPKNGYIQWNKEYKEARRLIFEEKDFKAAFDILTKLAKEGNGLAIYDLADMYRFGRGIKIDIKKSNELYEKAYAIFEKTLNEEDGNSFLSQYLPYRLGKMNNYGLGVEKNKASAADYFTMVPDNIYANYALGKIYSDEEFEGYDLKEAVRWLKKAADEGNEYALYALGKLYTDPEKGYYDMTEGVRLLRLSADQGNQYARYVLAKIYVDKKSGYYNKAEGVSILKNLAATEGNMYAKYLLGTIYTDYKSAYYNKKEGMALLEECAQKGSSYAQMKLGFIYLEGKVRSKNINTARKYFKEAAANGNPYAKDILKNRHAAYAPIRMYSAIYSLKKIFARDIESAKNQAIYEKLQREAEYEQNMHR